MQESTIATIATEALKPFSSIIDALLGPKIERIKNWTEKQELTYRLESVEVDFLIDQYLRRLLRRVCGITTIVFPQQVLPLSSVYEPLVIRKKFGNPKHQKANIFSARKIKPGNNYLIVDSAGMGKSTFAKHLVIEILNLTVKIPIFLELRRINEGESLLGKIVQEIDDSQKEVNEELLKRLLDSGNFVIILDGFDELTDQLRSTIGQQITELAISGEKTR